MKEVAKKWIEFAQADLDAAEQLLKTKTPTQWTYLLVLWHCHQTLEKGLKMILIKQDKEILRIHDLPRLAELSKLKFSKENQSFLDKMNKYYLRSRYPDLPHKPLPSPNKKQTRELLTKTKKVFLWLQKQ